GRRGRCRQEGAGAWHAHPRSRGVRPGFGTRVGVAFAAGGRLYDYLDPRRDDDTAQRLPAAQAAARLIVSFARALTFRAVSTAEIFPTRRVGCARREKTAPLKR